MGCSCCENEDSNEFYKAYENLKSKIKEINGEIKNKKVYLIEYSSIKEFYKCIKDDLESDEQNKEEKENNLKKKLLSYQLEKIIIISDYSYINNENENKFIIVNEDFLKNMSFKEYYNKNVSLLKEENGLKIEFSASKQKVGIKEVNESPGVYEFDKSTTFASK